MKAVVFDGPYKVSVQDRPIPTIQDDRDIIVKVDAAALCGSEMHTFRGTEPSDPGCIMGHEFVGQVVEAGKAVKTVGVGDRVVSAFTTSCGTCFYCRNSNSARCVESQLFGSTSLDGGQAEFVRVPLADGTVMKTPQSISEKALILMADIFPTGYYGVKSAIEMAPKADIKQSVMVVIGCGPVGLCAIAAALSFQPKKVFAVDSVESRLELARSFGAEPLNFLSSKENMMKQIMDATEGRGADMVVEVVGAAAALRTGFDVLRPFGVISSIGVHNSEIPWSATDGYDKNVRLQMGRCPVRSVFPEALALLEKVQDKLELMFDKVMPLSEAVEGYSLFETRQVQKVVFTL